MFKTFNDCISFDITYKLVNYAFLNNKNEQKNLNLGVFSTFDEGMHPQIVAICLVA